MVHRDRITGTKIKFGAKLQCSGLKIVLVKVDQADVVMSFWKLRIYPHSVSNLFYGARIIFLLRVGFSKQKVDRGVLGILIQQPAKNTSSSFGLTHAD